MTDFSIKYTTPNHARIVQAFTLAPKKTIEQLNLAMRAGLAEIMKRETDEHFMFKTPRVDRTGFLQRFFHMNTAQAIQLLSTNANALFTEIFSTVEYADYVAASNNYYKRILDASKFDIDKHFDTALGNIMDSLRVV